MIKIPALFQWRVLKLALTSLFTRAYTTDFPKKPFQAIPQFRGRPRFTEKECIGCTACAQVCPSGCIDVIDEVQNNKPVRRLVQHLDMCLQCAQCERYCTTEKGIKVTNEWNFSGFERKEFEESVQKDLLLCETCGKIIAPVDQILWLVKRLGPLAFCNPTLMLASHKELKVVDPGFEPKDGEFPQRARRMNIQCPHCRRATAINA